MFYDYLKKIDLSQFSNFHVSIRRHDDDFDFYELTPLFEFWTCNFDFLFDLKDLFDNFSFDSIEHFISGNSIFLKVVVYE